MTCHHNSLTDSAIQIVCWPQCCTEVPVSVSVIRLVSGQYCRRRLVSDATSQLTSGQQTAPPTQTNEVNDSMTLCQWSNSHLDLHGPTALYRCFRKEHRLHSGFVYTTVMLRQPAGLSKEACLHTGSSVSQSVARGNKHGH